MYRVLSEKTENSIDGNDDTSQSAKDFITRVLSPRVAVVSSQDADMACRANNFSNFLELIRPFGERYEGRITARDSQGLPNPIEGFTFRFADLACLEQPDNQIIAKLLSEKVKSYCGDPKQLNEVQHISSKADLTERYLKASQDDITPWYAEYRRFFFKLTGVSEHETFEHPVACIIVVSSLNPDPLNQFAQLFDDNILPAPIYEKGFMDPNILKYYVLLHDNHKTSLEHSEAIFDQMKRKFGLNCHLLELNSIPLPTIPDNNDPFSQPPTSPINSSSNTDIWSSSIHETNLLQSLIANSTSSNSEIRARHDLFPSIQTNTLPLSPTASTLNSPTSSISEDMLFLAKEKETSVFESQNIVELVGNLPPSVVIYGQYLSEKDFAGIQSFIREFVAQSMIPSMERNIHVWNEQVAASRRGITGRLFSASRRYFGTGGKSSGQPPSTQQSSNSPSGPQNAFANTIYPHTSPEAQMRKLADYAFMLRDYRLAHSVYDTIKKDFSADKAWRYYAGAQEMIGLCLLMSTSPIGNKTDIDHYFEQSVNAFYNRAKSPFFATKATILYYEMLKHRKLYKDAPTALIRMSGEDSDLRSALFLEQAAHAFLHCPRPMIRKYAFHLVMAGHRYGKCNQREHAYRCYLASSHVFEDRSWSLVEDHIHFALGRQAFHMGDLDSSLHFFLKLLRESRQPASQQNAYLREFLYIYKHYSNKTGKEPTFNPPDLPIPVILDASLRVVLSNAQSGEYDEIWHTMEQAFVDEKYKNVDAFGRNKLNPVALTKDSRQTVCAVAEPFYVQFDVYNPMQISINVTDLILECDYISSTKDSLSLRVTPKREGTIKIVGLRYSLHSIVRSRRTFAKRGKRLNNTKQQMMDVVYAPDLSLEVLVTSPMPLLEVAFHSFPEMLFSGEVIQVVLEINNKGQTGLTDLQVKMSHPSFFCVGDAEMLEKTIYGDTPEFPEFPNSESSSEKLKISNILFNSSINSIPLPIVEDNGTDGSRDSNFVLAPGKTTLIPIWIRGDRIGKHMFRFFFTYQSEDPNVAMKYRSLRYFVTSQVLPSLKISAFTRPSTRGLNEFILGIETENLQTTADFQLLQISSLSPSWSISPINITTGDDQNSKVLIAPRQTTYTYYRISKCQIDSPADHLTPEQYALNALERILSGNYESKTLEPSPIELIVTNLPFTSRVIKNASKPLEGFSLNSRVQWRINALSNQFPALTQKQHEQIFTLYTTNDVDLVIYWNIPSSQRQGHHYIIGINLGVQQNPFQGKEILALVASAPNRALFEQTIKERAILVNSLLKNKHFKEESPLKVLLKCKDMYEHNFVSESLCVLPIKIVIKNCSWNKHVGFNLELLSFDENLNLRSTMSHKSLHNNIFNWTGETYKYGSLSPNNEIEFEVKACFTQPGVYDINRWRLTVNMDYDSTVNTTAITGGGEGVMISNAAADSIKGGYMQMPNAPHLLTLLNT
ncbi:5163_t:CDS:10 [Ambispora gerdemannii]|uniref:5163_t:CDS:1 n=1 Tax=Ambispora gerdemannii TaxID=144530 RepID=A0A9N8VPY7_9GLOM|nr:5163_t:CDS:10 [Ambispora gerdemannii]